MKSSSQQPKAAAVSMQRARPVRRASPAQTPNVAADLAPAQPQQSGIARRIPAQNVEVIDRAYVAEAGEISEINPLSKGFFSTINEVKALTVANQKMSAVAKKQTLAQRRGYEMEDLDAIAEVAYHYLMNGAASIAVTLYEGLCAVAPNEAYFALGLGLAQDHVGEKKAAYAAYTRAAELNPHDARPDVNRAELLLASGDKPRAKQLLGRALGKAINRGDEALERKIQAILTHLGR